MRACNWWIPLLAATAAFGSQSVLAQAARSSGGNAQALQQLQQLAAERTRLMADNARLQSELAALKKERDEFRKKAEAGERRLQGNDSASARATARADGLQAELDREKARTSEIVEKFRELAGQLRDTESDRAQVRNTLGQRDLELKQCVDRNLSLYTLNGEILDRLDKRGSFSPASALEPFTRLKRVELENLIDGYQTRAQEQAPPTAQAPATH